MKWVRHLGRLTDTEARFGIMVMSTLAVQGGGVPFLTAIVAAAILTGLFTDCGGEDNLYLSDFFCQIGTCGEKR